MTIGSGCSLNGKPDQFRYYHLIFLPLEPKQEEAVMGLGVCLMHYIWFGLYELDIWKVKEVIGCLSLTA